MAFINLDNGAKVVLDGTALNNEPFAYVWYYTTSNAAGWSTAQRIKMAELVWANLAEPLSVYMTTGFKFDKIVVTTMESLPQSQTIYTTDMPLVGQIDAPSMPASTAICITSRTDKIGRSYRGRTYITGLSESDVSGNYVAQAKADALVGVFNDALDAFLTDGDFRPVVASFYNNKAPRANGVGTPINGYDVVDLRVDTQRRRLPKN